MDSKQLETKKKEMRIIYSKIAEITEYLDKRCEELRLEEEKFRERVLKNRVKIN